MTRKMRTIAVSAALTAVFLLTACEQLTPLGSYIQESLQLPPPTLDAPLADANGYSNTDIVITLNHDDPDVQIYYTIDRSDPGSGGTRYTGPFTLSGHNVPLLVKALASKDRQLDSDVIESEFLILYDAAEAPVLVPGGGSYNTAISVDMASGSGGASVWYTVDGTDPRGSATRILYDGSTVEMDDDGTPDGSNIVINAVAQVDGLPDSPIVTEVYGILYDTLSMPVLSPVSAQSETPIEVTMSSPDGAEVWYTVNGSSPVSGTGSAAEPSASAQRYTGPVSVNWSGYDSRTIKAACFAAGYRPSAVQFGSYFQQIGQTPAPTVEVFDPGVGTAIAAIGGTVYTNASAPAARIASPPTGTRYFYTTDGTMPMISVNGSTIDILTAATEELSGTAALPNAESSYSLNVVAVATGSDPSHLVTVPVTVDRTAPGAPGLTPSGLTSNYYINAARWADDAWAVAVSGGGGDGIFEWRWTGGGISEETTATTLSGSDLKTDMPGGQGVKTLETRERDYAGNWSSWGNLEVALDTVAPTLSSSVYPANLSFGQTLSTTNEFVLTFSEAMNPSSIGMTLGLYGGSEVGSVVSGATNVYALNVSGGLNLDVEYVFSFTGARDLAGNLYAGSSITTRFVTGALFWSAGRIIYRAPITSRTGYSIQTWYTAATGTTITDIEVADGRAIWSEVDSGGEGRLRVSSSKQDSMGSLYTVSDVSSGPIKDFEIDEPNQYLYYTAPDDGWTIRMQSYVGGVGNGEETSTDAPSPANLAWDGTTYYWSDPTFNNFFSDTLAYDPTIMILNMPRAVGLEYRLNGSNREFYGMIAYTAGGVSVPASANASSYVGKLVLNSGMTAEVSSSSSANLNAGTLWGNGTEYGGDIELVETGGVSRIYVIAPTITGTATDALTNEYCAVFSMNLNLGDIRTHYNPYSLGLTRSLDGALAIDTE